MTESSDLSARHDPLRLLRQALPLFLTRTCLLHQYRWESPLFLARRSEFYEVLLASAVQPAQHRFVRGKPLHD
jgi:hypothetical protein